MMNCKRCEAPAGSGTGSLCYQCNDKEQKSQRALYDAQRVLDELINEAMATRRLVGEDDARDWKDIGRLLLEAKVAVLEVIERRKHVEWKRIDSKSTGVQ